MVTIINWQPGGTIFCIDQNDKKPLEVMPVSETYHANPLKARQKEERLQLGRKGHPRDRLAGHRMGGLLFLTATTSHNHHQVQHGPRLHIARRWVIRFDGSESFTLVVSGKSCAVGIHGSFMFTLPEHGTHSG